MRFQNRLTKVLSTLFIVIFASISIQSNAMDAEDYEFKPGYSPTLILNDSRFRVYIPKSISEDKPMSLVVDHHTWITPPDFYPRVWRFGNLFHGASQIEDLAEQTGTVILRPRAKTFWNWNSGVCCWFSFLNRNVDDVGQVLNVVEWLSDKLPIDRRRVYAIGISNGAEMTNRMGVEAAHIFAAIAPITFPFHWDLGKLKGKTPARGLPVLEISLDWDIFTAIFSPCFGVPVCGFYPKPKWVEYNECQTAETRIEQEQGGQLRVFSDCRDGVIYQNLVVNGVHGAVFNFERYKVTDEVWKFLFQHTLPEEFLPQ